MQKTPTQPWTDQFHNLLSKCESLQDIRDLVQRLERKVSKPPGHSRLIVKHLLNSNWGLCELPNFLVDGTLNSPESGCFEELFQWLISRSQSKANLDSIYACIQKSLSLGLLSALEAQRLLTELANVNTKSNGAILKLGDTETIQDWYWMMAKAMDGCPVFNFKDLGQNHLLQWCFRVSEAPFAPSAFDTFRLAQRYLATSTFFGFKVNVTQGLVRKWVTYAQRAQKHQPVDLMNGQLEITWNYAKVADFLAALQPCVAAKSICQITEKLVRDVLKGSRQPYALEMWMKVLSRISISSADALLEDRAWTGSFATGTAASGISPQQAIILRIWTANQMATRAPKAHRSQSLQDLTRRLIQHLEGQLRPGQDLLAELLFTFQSLPLPSPSPAIQRIARSCTGNLHLHGSIDKLQADVLSVAEAPLTLFKEDDVYRNAGYNLSKYVTLMAERATMNPDAFLQLAHALIMRDKLSIKVITRILRHSRALNLSLAHAVGATSTHATPTNPPSHSPNRATSLRLLNSLARSFAISPVLSPRQSFRKVYRIYLHLHQYTWGCAIGPDITRALWHAGVTRYKETGTSPEKVAWILGKVREVEGHEVADWLLWFGAGGVKGWEEWMRQGCGGVDGEGWKRVVNKKKPHLGEGRGGKKLFFGRGEVVG